MELKILKFGGTSIGTAERMRRVADIVKDKVPKMVILSAMAGTTNHLLKISSSLKNQKKQETLKLIGVLEMKYDQLVKDLLPGSKLLDEAQLYLKERFDSIRTISRGDYSLASEHTLLAQGELMSSTLFHLLLKEMKVEALLIPALEIIRTDKAKRPDLSFIERNLNQILKDRPHTRLFITQGFICLNHNNEISNLGRGGSDYTATLIGSALGAQEIQIWTDTDGLRNNDPRLVPKTHKVEKLSFEEAAELAYFGAKILHPQSILPAQRSNIPVRLLNSLNPIDRGTVISNETINQTTVKAIAAKTGIVAIKIKSGRMLMAYGFLRSVFEVFEHYETPIDMITTSEVAVSLTIDKLESLALIVRDLEPFGKIEIEKNQAIICVVGDMIADNKGIAERIFRSLKDIPLRMISYGGSSHNISVLVNHNEVAHALNSLNENLF